jgi:hypothetical protein
LPLREQQKPPITQRSGAQAKIRPPNTQKDAKGITTFINRNQTPLFVLATFGVFGGSFLA